MIAEDEWLVVIDRQRVFAESEWSAWACPDGSYHTTDEASHDWRRRSAIVWSTHDMLRLSRRKTLGLIISRIGRSF